MTGAAEAWRLSSDSAAARSTGQEIEEEKRKTDRKERSEGKEQRGEEERELRAGLEPLFNC